MDNRRGKEKEEEEKEGKKENREQTGVAAGHEDEAMGSQSLPPRLYECVFCKGSFTSAQALGGHMNVHRRERALLRQSLSLTLAAPHEQPAGSPPQRSSSSLSVAYDQVASSSISPQFSATPNREKHKELSDGNLQAQFMGEERDPEKDDEELDLELRLGEKPGKK